MVLFLLFCHLVIIYGPKKCIDLYRKSKDLNTDKTIPSKIYVKKFIMHQYELNIIITIIYGLWNYWKNFCLNLLIESSIELRKFSINLNFFLEFIFQALKSRTQLSIDNLLHFFDCLFFVFRPKNCASCYKRICSTFCCNANSFK